jgi:hypothetical protein
MYGYAPRYPAREASKVRLGFAVLVALLILPIVAWGALFAKRETKNSVVFANNGAEAIDLVVDGVARGKIAARASVTLDVALGEHRVVAGGERGSFSIPSRRDGVRARGLYNVGGKSGLAIVTKYYAVGRAPFEDKVEPIAEGTRFMLLPNAMGGDALAVDRAFPDGVSVPRGTTYTTVTHLCRITAPGTVGCAGY